MWKDGGPPQRLVSTHPHQHLLFPVCFFFSFESGCEMVSVVLIYRSLMTDDVEHLSSAYWHWPFVCLLWRDLLMFFNWVA